MTGAIKFRIFAISGDGIGSGKTYLAVSTSSTIWSIASSIRYELQRIYPGYDWHNTTQTYKDRTTVREYERGQHTVRGVLREYGQHKCRDNPEHWVQILADRIEHTRQIASGIQSVTIDDVRKVCEIEHLKRRFPDTVVHLHVDNPDAVIEPMFDAPALRARADYVVVWRK